LVSPNILVTNHHVLNTPEVAAAGTCIFNFQVGADGQPQTPSNFRLLPDRLFLTSPAIGGLDYTFVWVEGEPGAQFGVVRINRRAFAIAENELANIISHPRGRMKEISVQQNEVKRQEDLVVLYASDTDEGSSGAAVCNNNWQLVALHHASKPSPVPDFPILNEGIKLSAIAADLERISHSSTSSASVASQLLQLFEGTDERLGFFGTLGRPEAAGSGLEAVVNSFQGTEKDIDVGFWNVEWLTRTYETKATAVADVIHKMNLDVWSLEESSPNAAERLSEELKATYGLSYGHAAAEPESEDGKQSCTLLWNSETVDVEPEEWGETIEAWLQARSTDFDDLGLGGFEAIHGKIFDRYPALFKVRTTKPVGGSTFEFFMVPVHLKAMAEGSLRRKMASKILSEAIKKKIEEGASADWVIGGDFNAALDTGDFQNLASGGFLPLSAGDEQAGAISYVKGPKSLIDHIFLSPNLARRTESNGYLIVAAEKTIPGYMQRISDHRPVLVRLSLETSGVARPTGFESVGRSTSTAIEELRNRLGRVSAGTAAGEGEGLEARHRRKPDQPPQGAGVGQPSDLSSRTGYAADFLGGSHPVPLPGLSAALAAKAVEVNRRAGGIERLVLPYTHYSVVMNGERKMPFFSAVNIDGTQLRRIPRGDKWFLDPRVPAEVQTGDEVYKDNDLDRGHMTRRLDPVWGAPDIASQADAETCCFTNACPQHKDLNQKEWQQLEDYILSNAGAYDLRVCVFTGPVLRPTDQPYRGILLPKEFWKVAVIVREDSGALSATGYLLSQRDMITGFEFVFGQFKTYQVTIRKIAELTGLDFGQLPEFDPKARVRQRPRPDGGFESVAEPEVTEIKRPGDLVF
jgi:DNA/RNA endonuclease G (NUC1)